MNAEAPLMLSVSGMRGLVGRSLTPSVVARYASAFGSWLCDHVTSGVPHVVLGRDSRPSGQMFEMAAASGLTAVGCRVITVWASSARRASRSWPVTTARMGAWSSPPATTPSSGTGSKR